MIPIRAFLIPLAVAVLIVMVGPTQADNDGYPHRWFAWHPVRLQGGHPIPSVQKGGRVVWLKTIERFRFFDHWVYREIGDIRELTQ